MSSAADLPLPHLVLDNTAAGPGVSSVQLTPVYADNCEHRCRDVGVADTLTLAPQPYGYVCGFQRVRPCAAVDAGIPCSATTAIVPFCAAHLRTRLKLAVRPSTLPDAGLGLFAVSNRADGAVGEVVFDNGDLIYYMEGEVLRWKEYEDRYGACHDPTGAYWFTPYAARLPNGQIVDALVVRGVLACANDPRDPARVNMKPSHPDRRPTRMPLFATRPIRDGEEIFTAYGDGWWAAFPSPQRWAVTTAAAAGQMLSLAPAAATAAGPGRFSSTSTP
jgi:hypothetical protein